MSTELLDKVRYWSEHQCFDSETREHAKRMLQENNQKEIDAYIFHHLQKLQKMQI